MIEMGKTDTGRFILRRVETSDRESIFRILSDEQTVKYLNMKKINSISEVDELIADYLHQYANGNKFPFAITDKNTGDLVGVFLIKLDLYEPDCFEYTVYIDRSMWNKGICSEVLPFMMDFAFRKIGTGNFRGFIMISNTASGKVLQKHGFILEKTFDVDGLPEKIESYLMTKEAYLKTHAD